MTAHCHYCGLPVSSSSANAAAGQPVYCCYGCSLADAIAGGSDDTSLSRSMMTRLGLAVFFSMNVMAFTFFLWSEQGGQETAAATVFAGLARYICLIFTIPVILLLAGPLAADAVSELRRGRPSLSMLLIVGVLAAFFYSLDSMFRTGGHVYFEVSCSVLVAVTLGKWLEATGKLKTTAALRALQKLLPDEVRRLEGGRENRLPRDQVRVGDVLRVLPGERIPVDGVVLDGDAVVDEQMVTGESVPVHKRPGMSVSSGTMNLDSPLVLRATAAADAGFVARIIQSVTDAAAGKERLARLAERLSQWFLPMLLLAAAGALIVHGLLAGWEQGLLAALSVVVVACPCALGLATPMAIWAAFGQAARRQVLIHHADSFAQLARVRAICFDKTGTLTTGQVRAAGVATGRGISERLLLHVAASLAVQSVHPLSLAVIALARGRDIDVSGGATSTPASNLAGRGLVGSVPGVEGVAVLGNERLLADLGIPVPRELRDQSCDEAGPLVWIAWDGQVRGRIDFQEELRPNAQAVIGQLRQLEIASVMLTGDGFAHAESIAGHLALGFRAELAPHEKLAALRELKRRYGCVAMVGDGINDAPALAAADIGIALGSGADISRDCAGLCLLTNDLARLPWLVELSRRTVRTIRWNLVWAFGYNVVAMGIAAAGLLHPAVAAVAMVASSLMVVTNSLRLAGADDPNVRGSGVDFGQPLLQPQPSSAEIDTQPVPTRLTAGAAP